MTSSAIFSQFQVYVGGKITQKEDALRVGLYIVRAPASSSRLEVAQDGLLKYLAKGSLPNDRCDSLFEPAGQIYDYLEWIARLTCHIPEKGAQTICVRQISFDDLAVSEVDLAYPGGHER